MPHYLETLQTGQQFLECDFSNSIQNVKLFYIHWAQIDLQQTFIFTECDAFGLRLCQCQIYSYSTFKNSVVG